MATGGPGRSSSSAVSGTASSHGGAASGSRRHGSTRSSMPPRRACSALSVGSVRSRAACTTRSPRTPPIRSSLRSRSRRRTPRRGAHASRRACCAHSTMRPRPRSDRRTNSPRRVRRGAGSRRASSSTRTSRPCRRRPCGSFRRPDPRSSGPWPRSSWTRRSTRSGMRSTIVRVGSASPCADSAGSGVAYSASRSYTPRRRSSRRQPGGIMKNRQLWVLAVSMLVPATFVAGCEKRTVTADVSPPPPVATRAPERAGGTTAPEGAVAPLGEVTTRPGTVTPGPPTAPAVTPDTLAPIGPARPSVAEFATRAELEDIHFDFDRYDIRPGDARILDASAAWLRTNPSALLLIEGHCDERGTDAYNLALGDRRAKAAMDYLVSRGIQADRITALSYGEERPLCRERSEECCAKNRRAHFLAKAR